MRVRDLTDTSGAAFAGTESSREHVPGRRSTPRRARYPCRIRRAAPRRYLRRSRYHLKASSGSLCSSNALQQQVVGRHALRSADDFAIAFGRQHIHAQRHLRIASDQAPCRTPLPRRDSDGPSPAGRTATRCRSRPASRSRSPYSNLCSSSALSRAPRAASSRLRHS